jgi:hypothetical protein
MSSHLAPLGAAGRNIVMENRTVVAGSHGESFFPGGLLHYLHPLALEFLQYSRDRSRLVELGSPSPTREKVSKFGSHLHNVRRARDGGLA